MGNLRTTVLGVLLVGEKQSGGSSDTAGSNRQGTLLQVKKQACSKVHKRKAERESPPPPPWLGDLRAFGGWGEFPSPNFRLTNLDSKRGADRVVASGSCIHAGTG